MIKIGVNGFGRIGRAIAKINGLKERFRLVAINDVDPYLDNLAYLFKYDSTYGKFNGSVEWGANRLIINNNPSVYSSNKDILEVDWKKTGVDIIIDSSGVSANIEKSRILIAMGIVKKVIITHSSDIVDKEVIMGINDDQLQPEDNIVSNSICDANAIAHVLKWIDEEYGIDSGSVTTLHPWLSYQNLVDGPSLSRSKPGVVWKDYALGRAGSCSLIPKNTTAVEATEKVLPGIKGKLLSFSYRVPTSIVASSDITLKPIRCPNSVQLKSYIESRILSSPYVGANHESLVSVDYLKEELSTIVDFQWLKVANGLMKIILWYDNEWGYSCRVLDLAEKLSRVGWL